MILYGALRHTKIWWAMIESNYPLDFMASSTHETLFRDKSPSFQNLVEPDGVGPSNRLYKSRVLPLNYGSKFCHKGPQLRQLYQTYEKVINVIKVIQVIKRLTRLNLRNIPYQKIANFGPLSLKILQIVKIPVPNC